MLLPLQKCIELQAKIDSLQEKYKQSVQESVHQIEENSKRHKITVKELKSRCSQELQDMNEKHATILREKVEEVSQGYKQRIDELSQQFEEHAQSF